MACNNASNFFGWGRIMLRKEDLAIGSLTAVCRYWKNHRYFNARRWINAVTYYKSKTFAAAELFSLELVLFCSLLCQSTSACWAVFTSFWVLLPFHRLSMPNRWSSQIAQNFYLATFGRQKNLSAHEAGIILLPWKLPKRKPAVDTNAIIFLAIGIKYLLIDAVFYL